MKPAKRENMWGNLALNVLLPSVLLSKGADWFALPPSAVLLVSLAFPAGYGVYDYFRRDKVNLFSVIGFVSILITGVIGLIRIPSHWIAVKEAAVPLLFSLIILATAKSQKPFVHRILFSPELFDVARIETALDARETRKPFSAILLTCTYWIAGSFAISAVLNYGLASWIVTAPSGTEEFNRQLGRMTALSWPVIVLPSMAMMIVALMKLLRGIETCTGLSLEEVLHPDLQEKSASR